MPVIFSDVTDSGTIRRYEGIAWKKSSNRFGLSTKG